MRYPEFLKPGGRIGMIAPSFGCTIEPYRTLFDEAIRNFKNLGYETVEGPNCREEKGVGKSNTPEACAAEINDFFTNDRSDIILSCGGGETMCEDLGGVDFAAIAAAKPKWFMSYSDNTNLVYPLTVLTDTAAVYGPHIPSFGMRPWHPAIGDALDLLTGKNLTVHNYDRWELEQLKDEENPYTPFNCTEPNRFRVYRPDGEGHLFVEFPAARELTVSGRLLGGCLDVLANLCGTRYDKTKEFCAKYAEDGVLWFLEACELNPMGVRCALWQLGEAGWFDTAKGFLIGRPMLYGSEAFGQNQYGAVVSMLAKYNVPVIMDLDIGHLPPQMPLISGAFAEAKTVSGTFTLTHYLK